MTGFLAPQLYECVVPTPTGPPGRLPAPHSLPQAEELLVSVRQDAEVGRTRGNFFQTLPDRIGFRVPIRSEKNRNIRVPSGKLT